MEFLYRGLSDFLFLNVPSSFIFNTASINNSNNLEIIFGSFNKIKLSLQESIDKNILPEPKIVLIPLILDSRRISETIAFKRGKSEYAIKVNCNLQDRWKYLRNKNNYPNIILNMYCTQLEKYNYIKMINPNITGDIPQDDMLKIKEMFSNGITLWHTTDGFLSY